jgi:hypothetical protein
VAQTTAFIIYNLRENRNNKFYGSEVSEIKRIVGLLIEYAQSSRREREIDSLSARVIGQLHTLVKSRDNDDVVPGVLGVQMYLTAHHLGNFDYGGNSGFALPGNGNMLRPDARRAVSGCRSFNF